MNERKIIFYDLEVFVKDCLAVFMDMAGKEIAHFWNIRASEEDSFRAESDSTGRYSLAEIVGQYTLCGYNNYSYDDHILSVMMSGNVFCGCDIIKAENDRIISGQKSTFPVSERIQSLDVMQQIDVGRPSLKQIEGNMGCSIHESSVPFDIDRPLTDKERKDVLEYCRSDVRNTIEIYKLRETSYFATKNQLVQMLPAELRKKAYRWNTTTISSNILLGNSSLPQWHAYHVPKNYWRTIPYLPCSVWDMWEHCEAEDAITDSGHTISFTAFGCEISVGMGGLHGAPKAPGRYHNVKLADVGSMYPSIIVALNALGNATEAYDNLRKERLSIKHSDKVKADSLKLILNSVYGNFKNQYSALYDPWRSSTVCIFGQIALFTLCVRLDRAGYEIININTDGVAFVDEPYLCDRYKSIIQDWEAEFSGLTLEVDDFSGGWVQRDVNNYAALKADGTVKLKGSDLNKVQANKFFANNNARIVQMAIADYLLYGTPPEETLAKHLEEPLLWMYVLKAGSTYDGVFDAAGNRVNKVNRIFAAKPDSDWTTLYKMKGSRKTKFSDAPERMFLWNGDIKDIPDFTGIIDQDHYLGIIRSKLNAWPKWEAMC